MQNECIYIIDQIFEGCASFFTFWPELTKWLLDNAKSII